MRWRFPLIGALLGFLVAPSGAMADPPRPGARYDGRSATGQRMFVKVAADGSRLADYDFVVRGKCREGGALTMGVNARNEPPTPIDSEGSFSRSAPGKLTLRTRRGSVTGSITTVYRGRFAEGGRLVTGTIESTFSSNSLHCSSGQVPYTIALDGTPGALFRGDRVATGKYGARGRGIKLGIRTFFPAREVRRVLITFRVRCRTGTLRGTRAFYYISLRRLGFFSASARGRVRVSRGVTSRERSRIRGRFWRQRDAYTVRGSYRLKATIIRGGRRIDSCSTGTRRFSGTFRSGPANLG